MASEVSICNVALGRIGISQKIEALTDPSPAALACNTHYAEVRDRVLEDFPWGFAQQVAALAAISGDAPSGWSLHYATPGDCLRAQMVVANATLPSGQWNLSPVWNYSMLPNRVPFKQIARVGGGTRILTNLDGAYLWYTAKIEDPNQFSALCRSAISWLLASELALQLRADVNTAINAGRAYTAEVGRAQVLSLSQGQSDPEPESGSITARM